ncbi:MAG: DUF1684 domain-containing protein [Gemmatimonadales bacterium]|jgi:hypothetical protein|nr:DUF1684 domain-containing protein [Gemmatimonadales bacterium]
MRRTRLGALAHVSAWLLLGAAGPMAAAQQLPAELGREREEYARWLATAPTSPHAIRALVAVGEGVTLGPGDADIVLPDAAARRLTERGGTLTLQGPDGSTTVPRGRVTPLDANYRLLATGPAGRTTVAVFGAPRGGKPPAYFPYDASAALVVSIDPPVVRKRVPLLGPDGAETVALEAGTVAGDWKGRPFRFTVRRLPGASADESELEVFFRDRTSGRTSYDGGRFVTLLPRPDGRYLLDFNRARNPFCAYSTVFPCPAPWPGNTLDVEVPAGERYERARPATG